MRTLAILLGFLIVSTAAASQPLWEPFSDGLEERPGLSVVYSAARTASGTVLFGTDNGLFWWDGAWRRAEGRPLRDGLIIALSEAGGRTWASVWGHGLYASGDGGATWTHDSPDGADMFFFYGVTERADGGLLAFSAQGDVSLRTETHWVPMAPLPAAAYGIARMPDGRLVASTGRGLYTSETDGASWAPLAGFPEAIVRHRVVVDEEGAWLAGTLSPTQGGEGGLYRSADGGETWANVVPQVGVQEAVRGGTGGVLVSLTGSGGLHQYTNGGLTPVLTSAPAGSTAPLGTIRSVLPADPGAATEAAQAAWVGTASGLALTSSDGEAWRPVPTDGASVAPFVSALHEAEDGTLFAGTATGLARRSLGAGHWAALPSPDGRAAFALHTEGERLWTATGGGLFQRDGAGVWTSLYVPPAGAALSQAVALPGGGWVLAQLNWDQRPARTVFLRSAGGQAWDAAAALEAAPGVLAVLSDGTLLATLRTYYNVELDLGVWRSSDSGATWERVFEGHAGHLSVFGMSAFATVEGKVHRSTDGGLTWEPLLLGGRVFTLSETDWLHETAWARTLRRSSDGGVTWSPVEDGFPALPIVSLLNTSDGRLVVGTAYGLVRSTALLTSSERAHEAPRTLLEVYPNPITSAATVRFELEDAGAAYAAVYDVLGRRAAVLVEGSLPAGSHTARWEPRGLAAGTYLVHVRTERGGRTVRVVVVP